MQRRLAELTEPDVEAFETEAKVGLLATLSPEGLPHLTLITSLQAFKRNQLGFGQFTEGLSKKHVVGNPKTAWLIMSFRGEIWRGRATWTHLRQDGTEYDLLNSKPQFRYNTYFGIHTVHYLDLVDYGGKERLPALGMAAGLPLTTVARLLAARRSGERILRPWAVSHLNSATTFKHIAYLGADGYPWIIPAVPLQVAGDNRLVVGQTVHGREMAEIPEGASVAVFGINRKAQSVLCRGPFRRLKRFGRALVAGIDIDYVYNTMPPKQGPVYPPQPLLPVTDF
jgi:hypothetical protein